MTNTKLNYNGIWKQNVSTSENALKNTTFASGLICTSDINIHRMLSFRQNLLAGSFLGT